MSRIDDPRHYQHTTQPTVPAPPSPPATPRRYRPGDRVTVVPADGDPLLLHMQRQVKVVEESARGSDCYMVELGAVSPDARIQGPIPVARLLPGWVEQDGQTRLDVRGRQTAPAAQAVDQPGEADEPAQAALRDRNARYKRRRPH